MKIVFLGTPDFALPTLEMLAKRGHDVALVISQPDRPAGRGRKISPTPVKKKALELGIPVEQPENVNSPEVIERVSACSPDVIVVVAFGQFIGKKLRELTPFGCINLHASLLPKLRGAAPIQRAIMNGYEVTGVSTMKIDKEMDAGDVYMSAPMKIEQHMTAGELHDRLARMGAELMADTLEMLAKGKLKAEPQNRSAVTYAPKLEPGERVIDWTRDAVSLDRRIRGLSPFPGAHCLFGGKRVLILNSSAKEMKGASSPPGAVTGMSRDGLEVQTGNGRLTVHVVKPEGKKAMPAAVWARGARIKTGDKFE